MQCDITKEEEVEKTFHKINATIGPIHILVNNAGVNVKRFLDGKYTVCLIIKVCITYLH